MALFVVEYDYTDDTALRDELRPGHRDLMSRLADAGVNLGSGIFGPEDPAGALLLLRAESKEQALEYTAEDPFRVRGAVREYRIREFIPFFGAVASL